MAKFNLLAQKVAYMTKLVEVEADNLDEAVDKAREIMGENSQWEGTESDDFDIHILNENGVPLF